MNHMEFIDLMEKDVVAYLVEHRKEWLSPSTIAREAGSERGITYNYYRVNKFLKWLHAKKVIIKWDGEGWVERVSYKGKRIKYRIDPPGEKPLEQPKAKDIMKLKPLDTMALLSLPDHLRKTALILCSLGEATASQISEQTGRGRAIENDILNQLVAMKYAIKRREGRTVHFYVE